MGNNEVDIHIKTLNADEADQKLKQVGSSAEDVGKKTEEAGRKTSKSSKEGAEGLDKLSGSGEKSTGVFGKMTTAAGSFAAKLGAVLSAIKLITYAIHVQSKALEENSKIAEKQQNTLVRLQYLGAMFKDDPEARKKVAAYSEFGRRSFEETANAWYNLRSKGGSLTDQQQQGILFEALEMGRTDPSMPLDTLVDMFSLYAKKTDEKDMNRVQNVLQQTITEAGGSGSDVAQYMPQFLPIGMSGGLTGSQAAGLWAYVTTQTADASIATTGLRSVFMGLEGRGTPEGQKLLAQLGVSPDANFFQKISHLSMAQRQGRFSLGQAEQLAGREGASILLDLIKNPQAMIDTVSNVVAADTGDVDITRRMIEDLLGSDEMARVIDETARYSIGIENIKGTDIARAKAMRNIKGREYYQRRKGRSEFTTDLTVLNAKMAYYFGADPDKTEKYLDQFEEEVGPVRYSPDPIVPKIINNYHNDMYINPVTESPESRSIGPRAARGME